MYMYICILCIYVYVCIYIYNLPSPSPASASIAWKIALLVEPGGCEIARPKHIRNPANPHLAGHTVSTVRPSRSSTPNNTSCGISDSLALAAASDTCIRSAFGSACAGEE